MRNRPTDRAVAFNEQALRAWLEGPHSGGELHPDDDTPYTNTDQLDLETDLDVDTCGRELLTKIELVLAELASDSNQQAWVLGEGAAYVGIFPTCSEDGTCDGALAHVDLTSQLRLASVHLDFRQFAGVGETGVEAVVSAMTNLAFQANSIFSLYVRIRMSPLPAGSIS